MGEKGRERELVFHFWPRSTPSPSHRRPRTAHSPRVGAALEGASSRLMATQNADVE
jgi:hypothetical protein